jgi:hypothetical protein
VRLGKGYGLDGVGAGFLDVEGCGLEDWDAELVAWEGVSAATMYRLIWHSSWSCIVLKAGRVDILNARFTVFCCITGCHFTSIGFFGCFRRMLVLNDSSLGSPFLYKSGFSALCNRWLRSGFHVDGRSTFAGSMGSAGSKDTVSVLANRLHCTDRMARRWAEARVHGMAADIGVWGCGCRDGMVNAKMFEARLVSIVPAAATVHTT